MRNLIIALSGILSITSVSAQNQIFDDPSLQHIYDSIRAVSNEVERQFPTWKTGDDNSELVGLFKNIITDPIAKHLFSIDPSVSLLHVTGYNTIHNGTIVSDWLNTLDAGLYPSDEFTVKYNGDEEIEHLYVFDNNGSMVREIMIIWDKSFDGENYTNLRTIMDSYFNQ